MKTLIYKDSSEESHLNQQLNAGLELVNEILDQYKKTNLKPISDKETLQSFFSDPVTFIGEQMKANVNFGLLRVNPAKLVDLLQEPEITNLLQMVKSRAIQLVHLGLNFAKFNKKGLLEADREAWLIYVDQQVCKYATTPAQIKAFNTLSKLIQSITEIHELGIPYEQIIRRPLTDIYLKFNGEQNPPLINLHGFNQLAQ